MNKKRSSGAFPPRTGRAPEEEIDSGPTGPGTVLVIAFSLAVIGVFLIHAGHISYSTEEVINGSFFEKFVKLPPNEIGDALAGIFGSLAFFAAAVAVVLQTIELREQRKELREQRKATQEMARSMAAQASLIEDERRERRERQASSLLDQQIIGLATRIVDTPPLRIDVRVAREGREELSDTYFALGTDLTSIDDLDLVFRSVLFELQAQVNQKKQQEQQGAIFQKYRYDSVRVGEIDGLLEAIVNGVSDLSESDKQRVRNLKIPRIYQLFGELMGYAKEAA